jgi:hypothetical protein
VVTDGGGQTLAASFANVYWHGANIMMTETAPTVGVGGTSTLTAITDYDVGPSPGWVEIYDVTAATILTQCPAGTRCSVAVSQSTATTHRYRACFSLLSSSFPPSNAMQCTVDHAVSWTSASARVVLSPLLMPDGTYQVTALSSMDVTSTPYYIQIYSLEGGLIKACKGTTCTATVTPGLNLQTLVAFVGLPNSTPPPPPPPGAIQANSLSPAALVCPPTSRCQGVPIASGPVLGPSGIPGGNHDL